MLSLSGEKKNWPLVKVIVAAVIMALCKKEKRVIKLTFNVPEIEEDGMEDEDVPKTLVLCLPTAICELSG